MNNHRMILLIHKSIHNGVNRLVRGFSSPFLVGYHRDTDTTDVVHGTELLHSLAILLFDEAPAKMVSRS